MKQRDVVWVELPFSDQERSKWRPALVVSNDVYNDAHPDILVCAVTSNTTPSPYKLALPAFASGRLPRRSMVRMDKLMPVEKRLLGDRLATVRDVEFDAVIEGVSKLLRRDP